MRRKIIITDVFTSVRLLQLCSLLRIIRAVRSARLWCVRTFITIDRATILLILIFYYMVKDSYYKTLRLCYTYTSLSLPMSQKNIVTDVFTSVRLLQLCSLLRIIRAARSARLWCVRTFITIDRASILLSLVLLHALGILVLNTRPLLYLH